MLGCASLSPIVGCDGASGTSADGSSSVVEGLYLGSTVSFRVVDGSATAFRFAGIECSVPHPDNELLKLCLTRAGGLPEGELPLSGAGFGGVVGEVRLTGSFTGTTASGTWRFQGECDGQATPCVSDGVWDATLRVEQVFDIPQVDPDVGPEVLDGAGDSIVDPDDGPVLPDVGPLTPITATQAQERAAKALAEVRALAGLAPAVQDELVNQAAQAHADYYARHSSKYDTSGLSPHSENAAWEEGFTGVSFMDRLRAAGVSGLSGGGEVMAFTGSPEGAITGWIETLYHRTPLVHPNLTVWGFGMATGSVHCEVGDVIYGAATVRGPARWPVPGATNVYRRWNGWESPQPPLPAGQSYPSGPIVTLTFANGTAPKLGEATLTGPDGALIPAQVQSPENDTWLSTTWAIYPYDPLQPGTTYSVRFVGRADGNEVDDTWSFTTGQ